MLSALIDQATFAHVTEQVNKLYNIHYYIDNVAMLADFLEKCIIVIVSLHRSPLQAESQG